MWQSKLFSTLLLIGFLLLFVRLFDLIIIRGEYYARISQENRIRRIPIHAPRGLIFDRNGQLLATNNEVTKIVRFEKENEIKFVDSSEVDTARDVKVVQYRRIYPAAQATAHVLGFVGEADRGEVERTGCVVDRSVGSIYSLGDKIGRMGVEASFDCELRGKNGEALVEVDSIGRKVRLLGKLEPKAGEDVHLSIDLDLQQRAFSALSGKVGAVVALKPDTGEILALVSSPSFNPEQISQDYPKLAKDSSLPLFNRAISGAYPPGSTFKIVTAAAGLEDGKIDEGFSFTDPGIIRIGAFSYANWYFTQYGKTEGEIDIVRAITRSTDTFFYKVGEFVGVERLGEWANKFGLGGKTGIDIGGETQGLVPTPEWKERARGERWFLGNTYHMSIGQGDISASPLQIGVMTSVIASGGKLCTPHVIKNGESQNFQFPISNFQCEEIGISQKTIDLITRGMIGACSSGGTAFPLFNFKVKSMREPISAPPREIRVACKTGTAEFGDPQDRTHAWLTAFGPAENPDVVSEELSKGAIVVTAFVEVGGEGSRIAAPIVKEILEEWFSKL